MSERPKFGFNGLAALRPGTSPASEHDLAAADEAAARLGFHSRETTPPQRRRLKRSSETATQFNLRAEISDINRFVEWSERNGWSYREAFARLVKHIDEV